MRTNTQDYSKKNEIINAQSFKKIREIQNPEEPVGKTILRICHMIGISEVELPDVNQICLWIEGIRKYYSGYAPEELYLACEMNHYGKLNPKVIHYGKFSIDYLSECLKLYEEKKQAEILREKSKIQPPSPPSTQKALGYHHGRAYWTELENWLKTEKSVPLYWDWGKVFQFLLDDGRLTDYPKEKMVEIYNKFRVKGTSMAMAGRIGASMSPTNINGNEPTTIGKIAEFDSLTGDASVKNECRKFVVQEYCKKMLTN
jgi:hypothetical protein